MSSPNHPTFDIEDAFSFTNTLDYTLASPDYFPASPGNTSSDSPNNSSVPIPPPTIMPPPPVLSPIFDPQELFLLRELLPPKKRGRERSSSFTFALPQAFEMGESSHRTSLERHKEQIKEILNHINEISLDRIEQMEEKIEGLGNGRQMGNNNKIALARFKIADLEQIIKEIQVRHQADKKNLQDAIYGLKNNKKRPSDC
uniref:Reverse transcriptase domain-containing protein n=1 Tax=Tanacetum cinerariifolium TaxID=118510 RepID=A0A6L2KK76_TANCI|nr:hypothetical protein [Tanacetum cinerariifolium]